MMRACSVLMLALLAACATTSTSRHASTALPPAPPLPTAGAAVYHIVRDASQLRIRVYRTGVLGDLGHNHVIVTSDIEGAVYVGQDAAHSGFKLTIPVSSLQVDPPAARHEEGPDFASAVSADDRTGTRKNMLGSAVLDASRFPVITLRSIKVEGPPWYPRITVRIALHGVSRDYVVPTAIVRSDHQLTAIGSLTLRQSDFGITPFSVLAGALKVADAIKVSFRVVASN